VAANWIPANWAAPDCVVAGTTLRHGGVSGGSFKSLNLGALSGDDDNAVRENRSRFRAICELPSEPRWLRQVHGTNVEIEPPSGETPQADAAITRHPGVVCVVLTADCLPVLLASADGAELAVAHAGWRGLAGGVLEATVREMSADPADLIVWLGPAISGMSAVANIAPSSSLSDSFHTAGTAPAGAWRVSSSAGHKGISALEMP
jgi:YfiH family protein